MTKEQEALKLALEALEPFSTPHWAGTGVDKANAAITAIKEALAQPAQERPWEGLTDTELMKCTEFKRFTDDPPYIDKDGAKHVGSIEVSLRRTYENINNKLKEKNT